MFDRIYNKTLSFEGDKVRVDRNSIHSYPAMLHPKLVDFLIQQYAKKNDILFDPFVGSGVAALQSLLSNHEIIGFDINPLALLIAKTKTENYNIQELEKETEQLKYDIENNINEDVPNIKNIDFWYNKQVIKQLGRIRYCLKNNNYIYKDFFIVCFALLCRKTSYTRKSEFKKYRVKQGEMNKYEKIDVIKSFFEIIKANTINVSKNTIPQIKRSLSLKNSTKPFDVKYNLVITSPPYGDSKTTITYGQFSSFGNDWINDINCFGKIDYNVDNEALGKKQVINTDILQNDNLNDVYSKIKEKDAKRAKDVLLFFNDYFKVLENVVNNLLDGGTVCFVVGNRSVKNVNIPLDQITAEQLQRLGLKYKTILVRDILNKTMPTRNSPTNKKGVLSNTMNKEYIVIFSK